MISLTFRLYSPIKPAKSLSEEIVDNARQADEQARPVKTALIKTTALLVVSAVVTSAIVAVTGFTER